ncbi:ATP-binding protein [Arenibacter sp. GZD96]|uniref:sensor histidine kinase n=1 Tax=Aurantibrevibacter litoralis TaxID=3106030 RepID=UPI002AFE8CF1|nr:ATP-binding protein [Arenibacter sp. GZD-96]MEA1786055.1 ATP-binding protein [Arenibacter sp. GZD-96]
MKPNHHKNKSLKSQILSFLFIATAPICCTLHAQINASQGIPSFTNYSAGGNLRLASQQIWNVNHDRFGFLYTGTSSGLHKFDGAQWELLTSPVQEFNTNVRTTLLAASGTFYYGALGDFGYVAQDSIGNTQMKSLAINLPKNVLFNDIWSIREVAGTIYFQSREAIFVYSPNTEDPDNNIRIWKPDTQFMYAFSLNDTYYVHQIDLGLFQETQGSLTLINGSEFLGENRVQVMLPYKKQGEFLVGAFSGGLYHYDGMAFHPFPTEIDHLLEDRSLYKALALPDNTYALSVLAHGFYIIDQSGKVKSHFHIKNSIPDQSVYAFHLDTYGNLWVGTNNGLSKIEIFSPVTRFNSDAHEVGNVLSLGAYDDNLYIGTSTNILYVDKVDGEIKQIEGFANSQVFDLEPDGDQVLASGEGVYKIQGNKATLIEETENYNITEILISKKHSGYVFTGGGMGIHVFKRYRIPRGDYKYDFIGSVPGVDRSVYSLVEDSEGEIWAGTQAGIISRVVFPKTASGNLDVPNVSVTNYSKDDGIRGLSGVAVNVNGKIYSSGVSGFYFFDKPTERFVRDTVFSFSDEIASVNLDVYGLGSNQFGDVSLNFKGEKRLAKLQPDGSYILQSYPLNLIASNTTTAGYTEPNGVYWFGTDEGLLRLDPNKEYKIDHEVPLYFESVFSGESHLKLPEYFQDQEPELAYKSNLINFNYIAPFFIKETLITYQTLLEGFDQDWSTWENKSFREFTNLPHGTYTFRVRAKNTFGTVSKEIAYTFTVLPPWYATWWAYLLYVLIFGLLVYALVKMQTGRLVAREKERTREKELAQAHEIEKAYENLKATQAQLIQSEKLASLGQLAAGIAHEIKNPMNFINNFSELSLEYLDEIRQELTKLDKNESTEEIGSLLNDVEENLKKVHHHGTRADNIVKSMLMHSRGGSGLMEPTNLNELIKEYVNLAFHGMRAGKTAINVKIELDLEETLPLVELNAEDFSRVILNLCKNAFDAMRTKGLQPEQKDYKPVLKVQTKSQNNGMAAIDIEDNGPGVAEAIKNKLFQPFFTTKKGTEGTGLGLSITHDIISKHKGTITIASEENTFTRFEIRLPITTKKGTS